MGMTGQMFNCLILFVVLLLLPTDTSAASNSKIIRIVVLGDSLTAGYGLRPSQAFPRKLGLALKKRGHNVRIVNAGVSGDTTAAGLARLDWAITKDTDAVIVELGGNDILRGLPPQKAQKNLDRIFRKIRKRGIELMIAGMIAPVNLGEKYRNSFDSIFPTLAKKYSAVYYPFFLKGVAMQQGLNQGDGIHPNSKGVAVIVKNILPKVEELIQRVERRRLAQNGG